jgi:hypothetical protein
MCIILSIVDIMYQGVVLDGMWAHPHHHLDAVTRQIITLYNAGPHAGVLCSSIFFTIKTVNKHRYLLIVYKAGTKSASIGGRINLTVPYISQHHQSSKR